MSRRTKFKNKMKEIFGWGTFLSFVVFILCAVWGAPGIALQSSITLAFACAFVTFVCME